MAKFAGYNVVPYNKTSTDTRNFMLGLRTLIMIQLRFQSIEIHQAINQNRLGFVLFLNKSKLPIWLPEDILGVARVKDAENYIIQNYPEYFL